MSEDVSTPPGRKCSRVEPAGGAPWQALVEGCWELVWGVSHGKCYCSSVNQARECELDADVGRCAQQAPQWLGVRGESGRWRHVLLASPEGLVSHVQTLGAAFCAVPGTGKGASRVEGGISGEGLARRF